MKRVKIMEAYKRAIGTGAFGSLDRMAQVSPQIKRLLVDKGTYPVSVQISNVTALVREEIEELNEAS